MSGSFSRITCIALTDEFLFYGTEAGSLEMFYLNEWVLLAGAELRIDNSIKQIYPNPASTRVVLVDSQNQVFLYNPVSGGGVNQSITRYAKVWYYSMCSNTPRTPISSSQMSIGLKHCPQRS
jgi:hypothetical protein